MEKKVTFICLIYNSYPEILSSLINQTHKNWELILIHDGKNSTGLKELIDFTNDERITYIETKERKQSWGHFWRAWALEEIKANRLPCGDFICITNADNWYAPIFCEEMVKALSAKPKAVGAYTAQMIHSYLKWGIINCSMKRGYVDAGNVLIRKEQAVSTGWNDIKDHSSDWLYFADVIAKYGNNFISVPGVLFAHN